MRVKVDFEAAKRQLRLLGGALRDTRGLLRGLAEWLLLTARTAFGKQASPEGIRWAALSPSYAAHKRAGRGILQLTGTLARQLIAGIDGRIAFVENPLPYAAIHQYGTGGGLLLEQVKAHTRRVKGRNRFATEEVADVEFGEGGVAHARLRRRRGAQLVSGVAFVGAHTRRMLMQPRPYLPGQMLSEGEGARITEEHIREQLRRGNAL